MGSENYENPQFYSWIETLKTNNKVMAITSLECVHASLPLVNQSLLAPTILFYKRRIVNKTDIPINLQWIFNFEYPSEDAEIDPEVEKQYTRKSAEDVSMYKEDKRQLDEWLKTLSHVKYTDYECTYVEGGARITGNANGKKLWNWLC